jgi:hypothetical protein
MQSLARTPAAAYRRVALEARIEASGSAELTRICLEEAAGALGQALLAHERTGSVPAEPLTRAQTIMVWLAQSLAPDHPLHASLKAFYGGLAGQIGAQLLRAEPAVLAAIRQDIRDVLEAAG